MKSPINPLEFTIARDKMMVKMMTDLLSVHGQFMAKIKDFQEILKEKKGDKGDSPTEAELKKIIAGLIPNPIPGDAGYTPKRGEDYFTDSDIKYLVNLVRGEIKVQDGRTPKKGVDYFTKSEEREFLSTLKAHLKTLIKEPKIDIEEVLAAVKDKIKPRIQDITGLEEKFKVLESRIRASSEWRGGGDTVVAGTNITITTNSAGNKVISSTGGGGGLTPLTKDSGDVDGSNTSFVFSGEPTYLVVDGLFWQKNTVNGAEIWTGSGGNVEVKIAAPNFDIQAYA
ncbi:MAG TPA: hypothetical protein V6D19_12925 [Stenomitos sp.]